MLILVLDSCGSSCGVGVWRDGHVLAQSTEPMERGQDARLMPVVVAALKAAGCDFSDLDRIAVTRGPGSFTGVRVGLAAARGIGLAAGKPVIGIDRFSIYHSLCAVKEKNLLVVINSKRADLFCRFFPVSGSAPAATLMTQNDIDAFLIAHPNTVVAGDLAVPNVDVLAACAKFAAEADEQNSDYQASPLYLRAPDVTLPQEKSSSQPVLA